jgi:transcriptional regulator of met regulon
MTVRIMIIIAERTIRRNTRYICCAIKEQDRKKHVTLSIYLSLNQIVTDTTTFALIMNDCRAILASTCLRVDFLHAFITPAHRRRIGLCSLFMATAEHYSD